MLHRGDQEKVHTRSEERTPTACGNGARASYYMHEICTPLAPLPQAVGFRSAERMHFLFGRLDGAPRLRWLAQISGVNVIVFNVGNLE